MVPCAPSSPNSISILILLYQRIYWILTLWSSEPLLSDNVKRDICPAGLNKICHENTNLMHSDALHQFVIDNCMKTNCKQHIVSVNSTMRCRYLSCDSKTMKIWSCGQGRAVSEDRTILSTCHHCWHLHFAVFLFFVLKHYFYSVRVIQIFPETPNKSAICIKEGAELD